MPLCWGYLGVSPKATLGVAGEIKDARLQLGRRVFTV